MLRITQGLLGYEIGGVGINLDMKTCQVVVPPYKYDMKNLRVTLLITIMLNLVSLFLRTCKSLFLRSFKSLFLLLLPP